MPIERLPPKKAAPETTSTALPSRTGSSRSIKKSMMVLPMSPRRGLIAVAMASSLRREGRNINPSSSSSCYPL
eukprot:CAMPEP_0183734142 /NCGR_PEP_ID=MMETSP0737-20130205/43028_1 /TAXON_ID=385413 /ORGANISM="Thalassiosira miniscula, Strain CCMP1093" /LENGTH=72 /DNA_ID=CAMNT_0025967563 /DNA_START=1 /DNA_END=216 /DNA_ORIENTATION=+